MKQIGIKFVLLGFLTTGYSQSNEGKISSNIWRGFPRRLLTEVEIQTEIAEQWDMLMVVTCFIHTGRHSDEIKGKTNEMARSMTHFETSTVPDMPCNSIFEACGNRYAQEGFGGERKMHYQGGTISYHDHECSIYTCIHPKVHDYQVFAWNPTITGTKVEDTPIPLQRSYRGRNPHWELANNRYRAGWKAVSATCYSHPGIEPTSSLGCNRLLVSG